LIRECFEMPQSPQTNVPLISGLTRNNKSESMMPKIVSGAKDRYASYDNCSLGNAALLTY